MAFSRQSIQKRSLDTKLRRAKLMAKYKGNKTYCIKYPHEVRDAVSNNYTSLVKRITEEVTKQQEKSETFTRKLHQLG